MMSISKLKFRLEEKIKTIAEPVRSNDRFIRPLRLMKTLAVIERKFDDFENAQPIEEKIFKTISRLKHHGFESLSKRELKNLAWALSKKLPNDAEKMLFTPLGKQILNYFEQLNFDLFKLVYFPLLYSYFAFEPKEVEHAPSNWIQLRYLLKNNKSKLYKDMVRPKKWLNTLVDHSELLSEEPTRIFVKEFLNNQDQNTIASHLESLSISPNSWFWDNLIRSAIKSIKTTNENEYFQSISRFLVLIEKNQTYTTDILAALLERYASTSQRIKAHEVLKNLALDQWGNPQNEAKAGWHNVSSDTRKMVSQWFVRADLEAFFKLFNQNADIQRFNYWMRFIDQINFSQIFLGSNALNSKRDEHLKFRRMNRGRLKELAGSTTSTNNAFLLKIGNVYIVDFSETGNACYFYNRLPYKEYVGKIDIKSLRNQDICIDRQTRNGNWQPRFDNALARLGIFPKR